jgi:molybdopterin-guanine dinucleotide biosynthesis protein B
MNDNITSIIGLTPIYRIVALESGIGKTSLGSLIVKLLSQKGVRVAVVKHTHEKLMDEVTDQGRYWKSGAETVVVSSPDSTIVYREPLRSLKEILSAIKYHPIVIAEGFRGTNIGRAIGIVNSIEEIEALSKEEKGLWFIVSNDVDVVDEAKNIGYNALLMSDAESLAGEIYNDAVQLIASRFHGDPELCNAGSWVEVAEKILQGLIMPYECPYAMPIKFFIDGNPMELDPKVARIAASILEGFIAGIVGSGVRPKHVKIMFDLD